MGVNGLTPSMPSLNAHMHFAPFLLRSIVCQFLSGLTMQWTYSSNRSLDSPDEIFIHSNGERFNADAQFSLNKMADGSCLLSSGLVLRCLYG